MTDAKRQQKACAGCGAVLNEEELPCDANGNRVHGNHFFLTGTPAKIVSPVRSGTARVVIKDNHTGSRNDTE